ncbi:MAG: class I SAM-dependent methyltransferase [Patescibacteria group bacterium]|nr:class I SAM-dependent methyltransferase [Patescibacteria group bacterium]
METVFLTTPSAELRVLDLGSTRQIFVNGLAVHGGKKQKVLQTVETKLSVPTLEFLIKLKGDWWLDEIERRAVFDYIQKRQKTLIERYEPVAGKRILDIGSGAGSSAFAMIDAGAEFVQGVEPSADLVELANQRAENEKLSDRVSFLHVKDTTKLPFEKEKFDVVTFNAVLEHIDPKLRAPILREAYRCLKKGGLLVVTESPNKAFPYDGHTTLLPLIPWLPFNWATSLASRYSRNSPRGLTKDQYIAEGIVGVTYWQIKKALPLAKCLNLIGGDADWKADLHKSSGVTRFTLRVSEKICRYFNAPLASFFPVLDLVFKKP